MAFVIDLNTQPSSEEIHSFDTHIDMDDINICNSSSNSATKTECSTEVIIHPTISDEEISKVGMLFGTLKEARQFYYNYVNNVGFEPHIRNTNFNKNGRTPINQSIQCKLEKWRLSKVELAHTHRCDPNLSWMFKKNRELSMHVKDVIERKDQAGIRPSKTFQALVDEAGGRSNMKFLEKDVRNYISGKLRINGDDTDAKEMLDYFTRMKEQNPNFFYDICVYSDNSLKHAFSTDARSRAAYKYEMSVAAFVGVNHHERSCLFGCALLISIIFTIWVPILLEHKFGAGMRSTQWSESMHAFFDKYLTCKSNLIQFVHQYDNCLADKEQQELECDAADNRGLIPCVSNSPIEKQFQYGYNNCIFCDVQAEFIKKCDCNLSPRVVKDNQYFYEVTQQKIVKGMSIYSEYEVVFCPISHQVRCNCFSGRPIFKRLKADVDRKIKNGTKKRRASSKHPKEVAVVERDKHLNKATERHITASKHPNVYFSVYC
ncbi:protein FAR-RED IMPAIRED RESPONSE 1-like [Arachis duranensis]|uniref:Protein FAR1-RELATED SEQUENCE n=1 Tax=Arachis duranensis TaxID=130453 RepID=A0A6P4C1U7_ARADU|nr:protein FAR-RED IMPAIRED RESPONSE 1-like [Arachis duranensis]